MPSVFIPQAEAYPQEEWGWRGIVNPAIWNPTPPVLQGNYTWYILDKDTGYLTGVDGTRYINDEGSTGAKDGVMYSGNYLVPSASGIDYPIIHDLGTEKVATTGVTFNGDDTIATFTPIGNTGFQMTTTATGSAYSPRAVYGDVSVGTGTAVLTFNATIHSGSPVLQGIIFYNSAYTITLDYTIKDGLNEVIVDLPATDGDNQFHFAFDGSVFDVTVDDNLSLKELTIPSNSYFTAWYQDTKAFEQLDNTTLPIDTTYNQTRPHNMTFTHTRPLTSQELDQLTNEPEMLFKVWFNGGTLVDGFSKSDIVEFYPGLEQSGDYIQELSVGLGIEIHNDTPPIVQSGDEIKTFTSQSNNDFQLEITTAGTNVSQPRVQPGLTGPLAAGTMYLISFDMELVSGSGQIEAYWAGGETLFAQEQLATKTFVSIMVASSTTDYYAIALNGTSLFSVNVSNWTCKEVKAIPINGATRQLNTSFGAQTMRIEQDVSGRVTGFVGTHQVDFKGNNEYIGTGTAVDGVTSDFTMMVAFDNVQSGTQRVIAGTSGTSGVDNKLNLQIDVDGAVQAIIGKTTFDITPLIDPNLSIHAFCAIYNHQTQEVLGAADGVALQSLGTVVFDGATDAMTIGNNPTKTSPYTGKVGEVIMSDAIESEAAWLTFWGRVKVGSV